MESLLNHITMVQEEELGVKEFQMAVLSALLTLMKEQESLNNTLKTLTEKEKKMKLEEIDNLYTDDSSDEEDELRSKFISFYLTVLVRQLYIGYSPLLAAGTGLDYICCHIIQVMYDYSRRCFDLFFFY